MHESLKEKIDNLDPWFDDVKKPGYSIHDVIDHNVETWVIWSDAAGYTVSHQAHNGKARGISGTYQSLIRCMRFVYPEFYELVEALKHASMSEHHPACSWHKGGVNCSCHVFKAKNALETSKKIFRLNV